MGEQRIGVGGTRSADTGARGCVPTSNPRSSEEDPTLHVAITHPPNGVNLEPVGDSKHGQRTTWSDQMQTTAR